MTDAGRDRPGQARARESRAQRALTRRAMARTALATVLALVTVALFLDPGWVRAMAAGSGLSRPWLLVVGVGALATLAATVGAAIAWRDVAEES